MKTISNDIIINQNIKKVFEYTTNLKNNKFWQNNLLKSEQTSSGILTRGSTFKFIHKFMSKNIEIIGIITEFDKNDRCFSDFTSKFIKGNSKLIFKKLDNATQFTLSGSIIFNTFIPCKALLYKKADKHIKKDLGKLKKILESID